MCSLPRENERRHCSRHPGFGLQANINSRRRRLLLGAEAFTPTVSPSHQAWVPCQVVVAADVVVVAKSTASSSSSPPSSAFNNIFLTLLTLTDYRIPPSSSVNGKMIFSASQCAMIKQLLAINMEQPLDPKSQQ
uniref:HDC11442 n=1 Tax=Drosophila melanogaster TaxID=7227 RepID=Q6IKU5_DROME|nr:TPA_inf: HDC11442 [Drosophila melanogaster]